MPMLKSPQGSARAGIEPGASRTRSLLTPRIPLHGCESATVTPSGDERLLFPAGSAVLSSGCASGSRVKSGSSRKNNGSRKAARARATRRCVVGCRLPRARVRLAYFSRGVSSVLSALGNGAPPQTRRHLNLRTPPSGSPHTKFGPFCNGCNRHLGPLFPSCGRLIRIPRPPPPSQKRRESDLEPSAVSA